MIGSTRLKNPETRLPLTRIATAKRPEAQGLGNPLRLRQPDREGRGLLAEKLSHLSDLRLCVNERESLEH